MIIALDIGATKIAAALVDGNKIIERRCVESVIHSDFEQLMNTIKDLCIPWLGKVEGVGVGCTGLVGKETVHFLSAGADKVIPLKTMLAEALRLPVVILNDAWAAAWGEYCLGEGVSEETLVYITVSTGIGGGLVLNGRLLTNVDGFAGHLGHLTVPRVDKPDLPCSCGRFNCVEAIASGTAIGGQASKILNRKVTCREVFDLADELAELQELIDDSAMAIAQLIANTRAVTGTKVAVLGGSVGLADGFRRRVQQAIDSLPHLYKVEVRSPALRKDADMLGAALMIQYELSSKSAM